jgi:hypothetical protein
MGGPTLACGIETGVDAAKLTEAAGSSYGSPHKGSTLRPLEKGHSRLRRCTRTLKKQRQPRPTPCDLVPPALVSDFVLGLPGDPPGIVERDEAVNGVVEAGEGECTLLSIGSGAGGQLGEFGLCLLAATL